MIQKKQTLHSTALLFYYKKTDTCTCRPVVSPDSYVKASLPGWFVLGEQQDSSEYLRFILDGIHEGLKAHNDTRGKLCCFGGYLNLNSSILLPKKQNPFYIM